MGKQKVKKRKSHSRDVGEESDGIGSGGKMRVVLRVPPPRTPSPQQSQDMSLLVSLPFREIAKARMHPSDEGESTTGKSLHKKHKKKHHRHRPHPHDPPTRSSASEDEDDQTLSGGKLHHRSHGNNSGKDLLFHKRPLAKEHTFQRVQAGPFLGEVDKSDLEESMSEDNDWQDDGNTRHDQNISLPIEINLNMLSVSTLSHTNNSRSIGGKDMSRMKGVSKDTGTVQAPPTAPPIRYPPPVYSSPGIPADSSSHSQQSDDGERKKKKRKKKKHKHHHHRHSQGQEEVLGSPVKSIKTEPVVEPMLEDVDTPIATPTNEPTPSPIHNMTTNDITRHSPTDSISLSVSSPTSSSSSRAVHGVKLPRSALKYFLKHLHSQIQRHDPDGVFAEPVTDDIAPGYSSIIKQSMDLQTMDMKVNSNTYSTVDEFKDDFVLMCNNAMIYNTPETQYYHFAKELLNFGLKMIQKEVSVRPDIRHGLIPTSVASPQPPSSVPTPSQLPSTIDYSSPFVCKLNLSTLRQPTTSENDGGSVSGVNGGGASASDENMVIDVSGENTDDVVDQSHLTHVQVGFEDEGDAPSLTMFQSDDEMEEESILQNVDKAYVEMKENMDSNAPPPELSFLTEDSSGKATLNILNPYTVPSYPVNLNVLADKVKAGDNASTVLNTELPVFKATPVSYLMYGPFGSFAPTYDTSFANLTKHDSSLLLSTYGSEIGVNYANSLQQFVKGCGTFAMEMADAILNSLTNGRHMKFVENIKKEDKKNDKAKESKPVIETDAEIPAVDSPAKDNTAAVNDNNNEESSDNGNDSGKTVDEVPESLNGKQEAIDDQLSHASSLLIKLESEQNNRLSQPPVSTSQNQFILSPPTGNELTTASKLSDKLVSLTSKLTPGDVVSTSAIRSAMVMSEDTTNYNTNTSTS